MLLLWIRMLWNSFIYVVHCKLNPIRMFPETKLSGPVPNSYVHISVNDLYILRIGLPFWLQQNRQTDPENI
jgi:hypothetical protein